MSEGVRPKGRSRRSCCWLSLGLLILSLVSVAGAFAWFYSHPISNDRLHSRVLQRLERISGLNVAYDTANLTLATGQYRITGLRFMDPKEPSSPVLTVDEVYATILPWQLISDPESVIKKVVLKNPSRLDLVYSSNSVKLGEHSQFLVDSVRNAQPPGSNPDGGLPFKNLRIQNVEVAFTEEEGILPDLEPAKPSVLLTGDLEVSNAGVALLGFDFIGNAARASVEDLTTVTVASGIEASVLLGTTGSLSVKGQMERLAMTEVFRDSPDAGLKAADVAFDIDIDSQSTTSQGIQGMVRAAELSFFNPKRKMQIKDKNVRLSGDVDLETSVGVARVRALSLDSEGARVSLNGVAGYKDRRSYEVSLSADRLDRDYRTILEHLLPTGWDVETTRDSVAINLHMAGVGGEIHALDGDVAMRGVTIKTPNLPASLKNLHGDLIFARDVVQFSDVTGEYAGARVALDGAFTGDPWRSRTGNLDMKWSAAISLEEILKLHGKQMVVGGETASGSGKIQGRGTWQQALNLARPSESGVPSVEGTIDFQQVSLDYPLLPAPISALSGQAIIDDNRLQVRGLAGKMRGSELFVDGYVEGTKFFWRNPETSASLKSNLDLAQIGQYLSAEQAENLGRYEISGVARTEMLLAGPLKDLASRFTGVVELEGVNLTPHLDFMSGRISDISGLLRWNGKQLELDDVTGRINDEVVELSGSLSANKVILGVKSDASLEAIQRTFPRLDKYLDMSGGLKSDFEFRADQDGESGAGSIAQVLEAARVLADTAVREKTFALNGKLTFEDATLRHIAMPVARTENGRAIPEGRVTNLNGTAYVKNDTLSVPEDATLSGSFADTENCRISGALQFRQDHFPAMQVKISSGGTLKLDTWAVGWGKGLPKLDKPPMTGKKVDIEAEIVAPSVLFRGQEAGRSLAEISFHMVQNETPRVTEFQRVVIQGNRPGQGRIIGSGRIESFVWSPQRFPRWKTSLDVQTMPIESMLTAIFKEPSSLHGMISGRIDLEGVSADARSIRGSGSGYMQNLEIGRTAVIRELGQTTGRNFGGTLFQTARAANFNVGNGALSSTDLALETNGLQLEMRGDYWFAGDPARGIAPKTIDGTLRLRLFKSVFGSIPIIGQVADLADEVANAFLLAFRVTGSAEQPRITPVPLPMFQGGS